MRRSEITTAHAHGPVGNLLSTKVKIAGRGYNKTYRAIIMINRKNNEPDNRWGTFDELELNIFLL